VEEAKSILKVAYACTAHKVQGQEFDYVILPMTSAYGIMLYKNLVYTAVTRAKKKVFIFGDSKAFLSATRNNRETSRNTLLHEFISRELVDLREEKQSA
jgi:exodeoxyribonuclease V alpha subunit